MLAGQRRIPAAPAMLRRRESPILTNLLPNRIVEGLPPRNQERENCQLEEGYRHSDF